MVLDDASPTFNPDDSTSSSNDAWSTLRTSDGPSNPTELTIPPYINLAQFPRPMPIPVIAKYRSWNDAHIRSLVIRNATSLSRLAQRRLSRPEWEAITYHCAKMNAIASWGVPSGILLGWARAYQTRKSFAFPFYTPKVVGSAVEGANFNPRDFAGGLLKGNVAELQWHVLRMLSYGFLGGFTGSALFVSYATMVAAAGQMNDERMRELMAVVKKEAQRWREEYREGKGGQEARATRPLPPQERERPTPLRQSDREAMADGEDGGEDENGNMREPSLHGLARQVAQRRERDAAKEQQSVDWGAQAQSARQLEEEREREQDVFDDASPTAAYIPAAPASGPRQERGAWDRLRKQPQPQVQGPGRGNAWMDRRRQSADAARDAESAREGDAGDGFGFESGEQERVQAQREFDGRVERERRGLDFDEGRGGSGGSGGGRGWR